MCYYSVTSFYKNLNDHQDTKMKPSFIAMNSCLCHKQVLSTVSSFALSLKSKIRFFFHKEDLQQPMLSHSICWLGSCTFTSARGACIRPRGEVSCFLIFIEIFDHIMCEMSMCFHMGSTALILFLYPVIPSRKSLVFHNFLSSCPL